MKSWSRRGLLVFLISFSISSTGEVHAQIPLPAQTRVTSNLPNVDDLFGSSVAVSGDLLIVGTPYDDGQGENAGAAYVFARPDGWVLRQKIYASDGSLSARFGTALDSFGNTLVVGAPGKEAAYVFIWNGTVWTQAAKLTASDGMAGISFGSAVAVDRSTIVVGSMGGAYVYVWNGSAWVPQQKLLATGGGTGLPYFGSAVAIHENTIAVGAYGVEAAYVFTRSNNVWTQAAILKSPD